MLKKLKFIVLFEVGGCPLILRSVDIKK